MQKLQGLEVTVISLELGSLLVEPPYEQDNESINAVATVVHANDCEIVQVR